MTSSPDLESRDAADPFERAAAALRPRPDLYHPRLRDVAVMIGNQQFDTAIPALQEFVKQHPRDLEALRLSAEAARLQGREQEAESLLAKSVELRRDSAPVLFDYANVLLAVNKAEAAAAQADELLARDPSNPMFRTLKGIALEALGEHAAAAVVFRRLVDDFPFHAESWLYYAGALRGAGRAQESATACLRALDAYPSFGRAYWSLANLKTFRFSDSDITKMESLLADTDLAPGDRTHLHFALGAAHDGHAQYAKAFSHYAKGNALHRIRFKHDPDQLSAQLQHLRTLFTDDFFRAREGSGCNGRAPIFLVGMARAGSTLVEQILASHSQIEGTRELFELTAIARSLDVGTTPDSKYPDVLATLGGDTLRQLGERYIAAARAQRRGGRPFFADKMGSNFLHIGLVQLIVPNAKIVDVRRHPIACCFSNFTTLFMTHVKYAYRLNELGRYYQDYAAVMAHFDNVLPGRVHRVIYERLITDRETEIRRLLEYLELPFEEACLHFHKTERQISTASSEQVRKPIYTDALAHWRNYEQWLGPLKAALGPVLDAYPQAPEFS